MTKTGPNEQRAISREHCGFYNAVVIGAIYEFSDSSFDIWSTRSYYGAVKRCIDKYPTLSVVVRDMHTDAAFFEHVPTMNMDDHISVVGKADIDAFPSKEGDDDDKMTKIEMLLPSILDRPWPASQPPWKIVILPLSSSKQQCKERTSCFVAFSFSHALGDGMIALAFHRTFIDGIFDSVDRDCSTVATPVSEFPASFDTAKNFPISWGYLLGPLIAVILPKFIADMLGLRATTSAVNSDTWTGARMYYDPGSFHSCIRLVEIQGPEIKILLQAAKNNGARLTGTLNQSIIRALSSAIPRSEAINFVSGTAVNMRRAVGISNDEMGFFVNAWYDLHERDDAWGSHWSEKTWADARSLTEKLASCAVVLQDQPVGLLRYIPSITKWTKSKVGRERDDSYEVSNLGAFEAITSRDPSDGGQCKITEMIFTRSANVISSPITVSVASVKDGSMVIALGWQPGALGVPLESESKFVDGLCTFLKEDLQSLR